MAHLGRSCAKLLEQVREERGVPLQLVQDLHIVEEHHALQSSKRLVVQHLQCKNLQSRQCQTVHPFYACSLSS